MLGLACATGCDDRQSAGGLDLPDEFQLVPRALTIPIDAIQQDLTSSQCLTSLHKLHDVHIAVLAAALERAAIPREALTVGSYRSATRRSDPDTIVRRLGRILHILAPRVNADNYSLPAILRADALDGGLPRELLATFVIFLGCLDRVRANGYLVSSSPEVSIRNLQRRVGLTLLVREAPDATPHSQRNEDLASGLLQQF
mmetsp:Transcript_66815/g.169435  ORF Transcript_66815/g.169435 Transcript_66815/m.169435 type:complete len:200 (-) Transcript_66815:972-1571(-)